MKPIRILHENVIMDQGGIENLLMNIYRNVDREKVQFDFIVHREQKGCFEDEITEIGGKIYRTPPFNPFHYNAYASAVEKVYRDHPEYKIVHCHSELNLWPLKIAEKCGIPVRIAHSHNTKCRFSLKTFFFYYEKMFIKKYCTHMFMCSEPAGEWSFGRKAVEENRCRLVKNGIVVPNFTFNETTRERIRHELGIENKIVIGHVGKFMAQKNHEFLIKLFEYIHKENSSTVLMLIGGGELEEKIKTMVHDYSLDDSVMFMGTRKNVNDYMQAMDVFVLPSAWEGLGIVNIEAQAAGLPAVVSDEVPEEAVVTDLITRLPLSEPYEVWSREILKRADTVRRDTSEEIFKSGYDIVRTAKQLEDFYYSFRGLYD